MPYFDLHHHTNDNRRGIYNLPGRQSSCDHSFSVGLHPLCITDEHKTDLEWLGEMASHPNCVAIGECGLDSRTESSELQEELFTKQLQIAETLEKPIIIHCVKRFSQLLSLCKNVQTPLIIHGFNKSNKVGEQLLENGFFLSFGKSLVYNVNLQHFFAEVPADKTFFETDSADISIADVYAAGARAKRVSLEEIQTQIEQNLTTLNIVH